MTKHTSAAYLDQEEVDPEGGEAPGQLDVLVLGVNLGDSHQALVLGEYLLLDVLHFHEGQRKKLLQAAQTEMSEREGTETEREKRIERGRKGEKQGEKRETGR